MREKQSRRFVRALAVSGTCACLLPLSFCASSRPRITRSVNRHHRLPVPQTAASRWRQGQWILGYLRSVLVSGSEKVPRPHASVFILPRSPSASNPSLQLCRRSFISVKFFVYLSSSKSTSRGTVTYAFVFYGTPSPVRSLPYTSLRDLSFTAPIIF